MLSLIGGIGVGVDWLDSSVLLSGLSDSVNIHCRLRLCGLFDGAKFDSGSNIKCRFGFSNLFDSAEFSGGDDIHGSLRLGSFLDGAKFDGGSNIKVWWPASRPKRR